ncbi:VENN motif pre-toxin domain-containing protein, partial [Enterobacter quasiroggenkampii]
EVTDQAIHDQMYQTFYNEAFNQSGMGTGQSTQRAITAATAAIQALAGGDIKAAIAGGAAPYIANAIANAIPEKDLKGRVLAHAVVNAALAAASGRDAASAAAGAAVGELVGKIAVDKLAGKIAVDGFGKQISELSEEDKQTVSALATLASGLAGGLVGDSSANAVAAAQAGKTTVENNTLGPNSFGKGMADMGLSQQSLAASMIQNGATADELTEALIKNSQGQIPEGQDAVKGLLTAWGEFFGVPVSALTANGEMTPQQAAEILASGVPTSEAKLIQYVAAKAFLSVAKSSDLGLSPANQKYVDILSPEAKQHILYGDSPTQGGHLYPGNPGKTVFPQSWSADKVVHTVGDIATSPDTKWFAQTGTGGTYTNAGRPARWVAWEEREGVRVRVVYEPASGKIVTAFPDNNPTPPALKPIKK